MEAMKQTPGLWQLAWRNDHDAQITFACVVLDGEVLTIGHGNDAISRARLIAAAPDLLIECDASAQVCEQIANNINAQFPHEAAALRTAALRAREAIARATNT